MDASVLRSEGQLRGPLQAARVLVVGDAMLDRYLFGDVVRISPEAPVPVVRVARQEERLGGAANAARNVKALGPAVTLIAAVGNDEPGRRLESLLQAHGVERLLNVDRNLATTVKLRVVSRSKQLVRADFGGRPGHEVLSEMLSDFARIVPKYDAVLFSDYGKGGLTHIPKMIEIARGAGKLVLVDPKGSDYSRYAGATVITPNRSELAQVIGEWQSEEQLHDRAQKLRRELRLAALLLTRSEEGVSLFDDQGHVRVQAEARDVFDVTGAGDTVIAVLAALLAAGLTLREAIPIANRAGGIVVGRFGTATVSYEELLR